MRGGGGGYIYILNVAHFFVLLHISTIWKFLIPLDLRALHYKEYNFIMPAILLHSDFPMV